MFKKIGLPLNSSNNSKYNLFFVGFMRQHLDSYLDTQFPLYFSREALSLTVGSDDDNLQQLNFKIL